MAELGYRLHAVHKASLTQDHSHLELSMKTSITRLYKMLNAVVLVMLVIGVAFAVLLPALFFNNRSIRDFVVWYFAVTGIFYLVLVVAFTYILVQLYRIVELVKKRLGSLSRVKTVSTTFAVAYCFHACIFIYATIELDLLEDDVLQKKSSRYITISWIIGQFLSIIWDVAPITILLWI